MKRSLEKYRITKGSLGSDDSFGFNGAFRVPLENKCEAFVITSDGMGWQHVSVHIRRKNQKGKVILRTPTWNEMCTIKVLFWNDEDVVMQLHPKKSEYINNHPHCLHLWKPLNKNIPTPPPELVGILTNR